MEWTVDELETEILGLSPRGRARLAVQLIHSLDEANDASQDEVQELWLQEIENRGRQIDAGRVDLVPASRVLQRLRTKHA